MATTEVPGTGAGEREAGIPTRLGLMSECDRQLLAAAAAKLVAKHRNLR